MSTKPKSNLVSFRLSDDDLERLEILAKSDLDIIAADDLSDAADKIVKAVG